MLTLFILSPPALHRFRLGLLTPSPGPAAPQWLLCHCCTAVPLRKHSNPPGMKSVWEALFAPGLSVRLSSLRGEPRQYYFVFS